MAQVKVSFVCDKEPLLAQFYDDFIGDTIRTALAELWDDLDEAERAGLCAGWKLAMLHEARRQEHYDFVETDEDLTDWQGKPVGKKKRHLLDDNGTPRLLIPDLVITDS